MEREDGSGRSFNLRVLDGGRPVEGWVRVAMVQRERGLFLVRLPQPTLENGQYVTVSAGQLRAVPDADKQEVW